MTIDHSQREPITQRDPITQREPITQRDPITGPDPSSEPAPAAAQEATADHTRMGVGARFTLHPATDAFVDVIVGALAAGRAAVPAVAVRTDDVSTLLRGSEQDIAEYLTTVVAHAAAATPTGHVVATVALSRGCPGEVGCTLPTGELAHVAPVDLPPTGLAAAAHWALYPLGTVDAMGPIEEAIGRARAAGTWAGAENFATRLEGDLAAVLATLVDTWTTVGRSVAHVAAHATVSVGSPSARREPSTQREPGAGQPPGRSAEAGDAVRAEGER